MLDNDLARQLKEVRIIVPVVSEEMDHSVLAGEYLQDESSNVSTR